MCSASVCGAEGRRLFAEGWSGDGVCVGESGCLMYPYVMLRMGPPPFPLLPAEELRLRAVPSCEDSCNVAVLCNA